MKFLIIGASGLVGSAAFHTLKSMGHHVVGTESKARTSGLEHFDLFCDDIPAKVDFLLNLFSADNEVVHIVVFAFVTQIDTCFIEKEKSYLINVIKMKELLSYLNSKNLNASRVRIIFISTSFVFDGKQGYYAEGALRDPICEYGKHKLMIEEYIEKTIPGALILRLDKMMGDGGERKDMFSEWYVLMNQGREVVCIDGQLFSPTYVADAARGLVLACERDLSGVFHFANTEFFTREELARQFAWYGGWDAHIVTKTQEELGFSDFRPLKTYLDSSKFIEATGMRFTPMRKVFGLFFENINRGKKW